MTNRINKLFESKKENILSIFFTAGHPNLNSTLSVIENLQKSGVDMIEVGMPFSDPVADGETIQQSSLKAINNGMTVVKLLEQLRELRQSVEIPILLMGYFNPILQYGVEKFCIDCAKIGIDGLIIPDLPLNEYNKKYKTIFEKNKLHNILLISPQTPNSRVLEIDKASSGFIYMVSSSSTTGSKKSNSNEQKEYFDRIKSLKLNTPTVIGFGISDKQSFNNACKSSSGAIIGSAFVKALEAGENNIPKSVDGFVSSIIK